MTVVRWATVTLGLALAALEPSPRPAIVGGLVLVTYAAGRTVWPLQYHANELGNLVAVVVEVILTLAVVVATGYWSSPYVFSVTAALMAAGFARGFASAIRMAVATSAAVAIPLHLEDPTARVATSFQWAGELVLIALVAGYARRLFGEAQARLIVSQQANDLLLQLHTVAQHLPSSLDLDDTASALAAELRRIAPAADTFVVTMFDQAALHWSVLFAEGVRLPLSWTESEAPLTIREAAASRQPLVATSGLLVPDSRAGLYLPLTVGDRVVGVAVIETRRPGALPEAARFAADNVVAQASLALDNARWFSRLRTVGADEERQRIARDLHDRLGQSLTYLSFELDRLSRSAAGSPVASELERLRTDARMLVSEVRDTLYDLRTDVTDERDLGTTLAEYLGRIRGRASSDIHFEDRSTDRLPMRQEREVWRIAQEAVTNAIRHAGAGTIHVRWTCTAEDALLEVADDGAGLPEEPGRAEAFGITGMRERAASINAVLEVASIRGQGTTISCRLKR